MFRAQLSLMLHKKSFQFSFILMLCIASFYPAYSYIKLLLMGHVTLKDDIMYVLSWIDTPYLFSYYNYLTGYLYYLIPIIVLFPFAISYITEKKYNYASVCASRCGKRSYLMVKAVCSMLGGFLIFFIPSCINVLWNFLIMPEAFQSYSNDAYYLMHYQMNLQIDPHYISPLAIHGFRHPIFDSLLSCLSISLFAAVCALIVYTISLLVKKFAYLASFPLIVILLVLQRVNAVTSVTRTWIGAVDPIAYVCSDSEDRWHFGFYLLLLAICTIVCLWIINNKSKKDLI